MSSDETVWQTWTLSQLIKICVRRWTTLCPLISVLKNGIRPSTRTKSGMLESGVDRIITQVVDPKLNHIFRPHIEDAIHDFLAAEKKEEGTSNSALEAEQQETTSNTAAKTQ
ncbi:hypothetical protein ABG768_015678 [Culter alburnus]|uniref:Uncharacterized protein n=1 Tax=Culter alburnus TaxID=194366 RepID=A0AAW1Z4S7_CULAL